MFFQYSVCQFSSVCQWFLSVSQWLVRPKVPSVLCGPPQYQFSCQCALTQFQHVQTCTPTSNALSAHYCGPIHPSFCMHASLFHSYFIQGPQSCLYTKALTHSWPTHIPMQLHSSSIVWPYYTHTLTHTHLLSQALS